MKRETRANLLFLGIFLLFSVPGAVILFHKKLDPSAPRMDQPDPIVRRLPYMASLPAPPGVTWIVPPRTQQWLAALAQGHGGAEAVLSAVPPSEPFQPVISRDHRLQAITFRPWSSGLETGVIIWDAQVPADSRLYSVTSDSNGQVQTGQVIAVEQIPLPLEVRRELVRSGMIRPPQRIIWLRAHFPSAPPNALQLTLMCRSPAESFQSSVQLPTPHAPG